MGTWGLERLSAARRSLCLLSQPDDTHGYMPELGETLIRSDGVASILVYREGRPIKIVYPDGRVEPFASRQTPH